MRRRITRPWETAAHAGLTSMAEDEHCLACEFDSVVVKPVTLNSCTLHPAL
jgi:hypothetical protein